MRTEREMFDLIIGTAEADPRIRAVILNGSRANPRAPRDIFQDFDIVYVVTEVAPFADNLEWIERFGEIMIMQMPEVMLDPPPAGDGAFVYLMQFVDGNRIDLTLVSVAHLQVAGRDTLSVLLLDKDGIVEPFPPPDESDYLPRQPSADEYADACNEFWWVATYVAKGLWRRELPYAKGMMDQYVRRQLMKMLDWYVGVQTDFTRNPGKLGKYLEQYLEPELWQMLLATYAGADYEDNWDALLTMGALFRKVALTVGDHFGFEYPHGDDRRVTAHLEHVRRLPDEATTM